MGIYVSGGPKAGRRAVFHLMPQNREFAPSMGALEVTIDGTPVLCNINMSVYGLNSALTNTMCFEDGGAVTNGQYLNGDVAPDSNGLVRRFLADDRFVYAHIVVTHALDSKLKIRSADRVFILDRKTGVILLSDAFSGERDIRFATHLHCSGSVTDLGSGQYRLTGGQANLIAGIKGGSKGLEDADKGELFVQALNSSSASRVVVEEPTWVPGYIYGLNHTGQESLDQGRYPHYRRWRLELCNPVRHGKLLTAISMQSGEIRFVDGTVKLPQSSNVQFGYATLAALGVSSDCECLLCDGDSQRVMAVGLRILRHGNDELEFAVPVDMSYDVGTGNGAIYASGALMPLKASGFQLDPWTPIGEENWRTHNPYRAVFTRDAVDFRDRKVKA